MSTSDPRKKYEEYLGKSINFETQEFDTKEAKKDALNKKDKLNILLIGSSGFGKSTLLNAVFGDIVAKTGVGEPITQELKKYHIPTKGLTLWDTKGIESKDYEGTFQQLIRDINDNIQEALASDNPYENLPHVAWLCIKESSSRVEEREKELLRLMRNKNIPTVVVFTKADLEDDDGTAFFEKAKEIIDNDVHENKKMADFIKNRYVRVNSVATKKVEKFGLDTLLELTAECLEEVQDNFLNFVNTHCTEDGKKEESLSNSTNHLEALWKAQEVGFEKKFKAMIDGATKKVNSAVIAAGAAGATPIPVSDMFLIAGIQSKMIYDINVEFEIDDELNSITSIIMGVLGTTGLGELAKTAVRSLIKIIPFVGSWVGGVVSGLVAATITKSIGYCYIEVLKYYYDPKQGKVILPEQTNDLMKLFTQFYPQIKQEMEKKEKNK